MQYNHNYTFFFIITRYPWPPWTSSEKTSRKCFATPLNVRSIDSSFLWSNTPMSSWIFYKVQKHHCLERVWHPNYKQNNLNWIQFSNTSSPASNSACLFWSSSLCSVKFTYWSNAFLLTWLNCCSCSLHLCNILYSSLMFLLLYLKFATGKKTQQGSDSYRENEPQTIDWGTHEKYCQIISTMITSHLSRLAKNQTEMIIQRKGYVSNASDDSSPSSPIFFEYSSSLASSTLLLLNSCSNSLASSWSVLS